VLPPSAQDIVKRVDGRIVEILAADPKIPLAKTEARQSTATGTELDRQRGGGNTPAPALWSSSAQLSRVLPGVGTMPTSSAWHHLQAAIDGP